MPRRHPKRKTGGGRFARLPLTVLGHDSVKSLSHAEFRVLVLLAAEFNGRNNGALGITRKQAAENGVGSGHTLYKALRTLEERGLIAQTYPASRVPPRPTMFALTWLSHDDTQWSQSSRVASHSYRHWTTPRNLKLKVVAGRARAAGQD